jgi:CheY-like chemotaxis protein
LKKILLVEDNPDDEILTLRALGKSGFELQTTVMRDGKEALDYLLQISESSDSRQWPDLVFLDLKLPFISGLEILERIKSHPKGKLIPIVVLTSSKQEEDIMKSYDLGANSYVRKRVNALEFEEALKDILSYWFEFTQLPPR